MLAIKLQRIGKKHQPSYRIVVAERRSKMAAPPVEDLGSYNPFTKAFTLNKERVAHWMKMGAQPTATAHNFLVSRQAISGKKTAVKMKKMDSAPSTSSEQASSPQVEKPAEAVKPAEEAVVAKAEVVAEEKPVDSAGSPQVDSTSSPQVEAAA